MILLPQSPNPGIMACATDPISASPVYSLALRRLKMNQTHTEILVVLDTGSDCAVWAGLELLHSWPPSSWDSRCKLLCLAEWRL